MAKYDLLNGKAITRYSEENLIDIKNDITTVMKAKKDTASTK